GVDWLRKFLKRNKRFSIRSEATSLSKATSFNSNFFDNLTTVMVGSVTSTERRINVILLIAVSAAGISVPPMLLFSRKKDKDHFVRDGPPVWISIGNAG
ncbi:hypothetical protein ALC53_12536, partial [Atta colombica]